MSEWKEILLKNTTSKIGSGATPRGGSNVYKNEGISLIRSQNVLDLKFSENGLALIDEEQADELKNVIVEKDDILLNITGDSVARACKVPLNILPARVNQHVSIIRTKKDKLNSDFLLYYLIFRKEELLSQSEIGATRRAITKGMLEQFPISLPSLPEQRAIASILSSLDDKIDLLHRQNQTLEKMAETLFRQWFVEEAKDSKTTSLKNFAANVRINAKAEDLTNYDHYVGLEHIPRKNLVLSSWGITDILTSNKSVFKKNDILFGKLRSYFHKVVFAPIDGVCSTDILVIRPKKEEWFPFCLFWFSSEELVEFSDLGSGGTRMPRTNWEIISNYQIPEPSNHRIEEFNSKVRPMITKMTHNIDQIRTLTALRDTLLPRLMSGEIRCFNDAQPGIPKK